MSGYCDCVCRDCFDVAITSGKRNALCLDCKEAGCSRDGDEECQRKDVYGCDEDPSVVAEMATHERTPQT